MGNRRLWVVLAALALLASGIVLGIVLTHDRRGADKAAASSTYTTVTQGPGFLADFEVDPPGWQQFTGLQYEEDRPLADSFSLVHDPVREGNSAARFTAQQGYSRFGANEDTEAVWHSGEREGDDYWYAWSTLFPTDWQSPYHWGIFAQWHAPLPTSPIIAFDASADTASLDVHTGLTDATRNSFAYDHSYPLLSTLDKGHWNDFVMHVRWTRTTNGVIQVFHRVEGQRVLQLLVSIEHIPTFQFVEDGSGVGTYLLLGIYRGSYCAQPTVLGCTSSQGIQPPSVVYEDQFARAETFAGVVAKAFPGSPPVLPR